MAAHLDTIETSRLLLRGIDETDADAIVKWRSVPEVYQYFKSPHQITKEEHLNWYHKRYLFNDRRFDWMCLEKDSNERIGVFGLSKESDDVAEVNYLLAPEAQHKGFAKEAVEELVRYAAIQWGTSKVIAEIHDNNSPSIQLAQRLGFHAESKEGPFTIYAIEVKGE